MSNHHIVRGQHVSSGLIERAKELRRQMTPAERAVWELLRNNQLDGFHFRRQQIIGGYIVDFYCHATHVIVEVDGEVHLSQLEYDAERDRVLAEYGFRVVHVTNDEVMRDIEAVMARIREVCSNARST